MPRTSITMTNPDGQAEEITFDEGSGNVFADLGFPQPEEHLQKVRLLHRLDTLLKERGLTQIQAAALLGVDQPSLSRLLRGAVRGVSLEKLMQFLARLDQHVLIVVTPRARVSDVLHVDVSAATADDPSLVVRVAPSTRAASPRRRVAHTPRTQGRTPRVPSRSRAT